MFSIDKVRHNLKLTSKRLQGSANFIDKKKIQVYKKYYERITANAANCTKHNSVKSAHSYNSKQLLTTTNI